jgi:isopentenyl-diphosphate Delta-isomerase
MGSILADERAGSRLIDKPNMHTPSAAQRQDEIFDVVDWDDNVVRQATRAEVHAKNLLHRAVHVLVFNTAGQVFLQKRSIAKDSFPGRWESSCSGHLDAGEDYLTAAVRELEEEIGVASSASDLEFKLKLPPEAATGWEFVSIFTLRYDGPTLINPAEVDRGEWFTAAEVARGIVERPHEFTSTFKMHWPRVGLAHR